MPDLAICPDRAAWQRFVLGQMPAVEIEHFEQHLNRCDSCLAAVQKLSSNDSLVESVKAQAATPAPPETDTVRALMARLQAQPSAATEMTTELCTTPTPASESATLAPAAEATESLPAPRGRYDFLAPPKKPDEIGRLGPYRILEVLGAGGMGVVFRAESLQLKRIVALKVMLPAMAAAAGARERFLREARAAAVIEHENVLTIYRVGEDRDVPFLAMQLLKGESLDDRLQREGRLPIAEVLRIGRETAAGLQAAHEHGLIHRDIKPANLWLEGDRGRIKILDFGLARAIRENVQLTQTGLIIGTPAYMAPEQSRAAGVDPRADLFSLGCVLYRCCTGRVPFNGTDTISILASLALDDPLPPRQVNAEVPPGLSKLVMQLLAKDPSARPPSARAVVQAITTLEAGGSLPDVQAIAKGAPVSVAHRAAKTEVLDVLPATPARRQRSVTVRRKPMMPARKRRWPWAVAAVVLLAILVPLGYWCSTTVIRLANGKGQLVIETDDPDVEVRVKRNGEQVTIVDAKTNKEITLQAGTYQLELVGGKEGLTLSTNQFALNRGDRQIVKVRFEEGVRLLEGRQGRVWDVAFSPDGRRVASCGENGTIRLWDVASGQELRCFRGHTAAVRTVSFTPDGRSLLSVSHDRTMRLWNVETGDEIRCFKGHTGALSRAALSPDGRRVLSGTVEGIRGALWVWDVETANVLQRFEDVSGQVFDVAWSPDGKTVLSAMHNGLWLWNVATGKRIRTFAGHSSWVLCAAFSSDAYRALSGSRDNTMRLWDVASGQELCCFAAAPAGAPAGKAGIHGVALSREGRWALSAGSDDGTLRLWDAATGKEFRRLELQGVGFTSVAFSPNGTLAASGAVDGFVRLWRLPELPRNKGRVVNPPTERKLQPLAPDEVRRFEGHRGPVRGVAISPDGTRALSVSGYPYGDRTIRLWDLRTGQQIRVFSEPGMTWAYHVAFLPDGRRALSGSEDNVLRLWDLETGKVLRRTQGGKQALVVTRDGRQAFVDHPKDHAIHVCDVETGKDMRQFIGHSDRLSCLALSPDGHSLLSGAWDSTMRLWDVETGKERRQFPGHPGCITGVAFSPDGNLAASGSPDDELVRLWDVKTGKELHRLKGHHGRIPQALFTIEVAFLPDGQRLLSWSLDKTLRLWDVASGKELHCFRGHQNWVQAAAVTPKGDFVLSGSGGAFEGKWSAGSDFSLRLWKVPPPPEKKVDAAEKAQPLR